MTATISETGLVYGLDDHVYRAEPGLSSTGVKLVLDSPARFEYESTHRTDKRAFDIGHAVHAKVLGAGLGVDVVQTTAKDGTRGEAADFRTKSAQEHRDEIRAAGLIPVLRSDLDRVDQVAKKVREHDDARTLLEAPGDSEVSCFWDDPFTGVRLKGRFDRLASTAPFIVDVKTTGQSAKPTSLRSVAARLGWGEQACHYKDGAWAATGAEHRFIHVVVEVDPPHLVSVVELDADFLAIAEERRRHAIDTYARCMAAADWPAYGSGIAPLRPPGWFGTYDLDEEGVP